MHAFLVSQIPAEYPPAPDTFHLVSEESIGIAEIRLAQSFLNNKPLKNKQNVVIIHAAQKLTLPAQQALLKTLEEPPGNSLIYLVTDNPESLLPTILSRVQVIDESIHRTFDQKKVDSAGLLLEQLQKAGVGERLAILDKEEFTRDTALEFLDNLEQYLHQHLRSSIYDLVSTTRKYLKANVNVKLALDHLALNL
jgi:DNA polymerase-3 subunit delta'